MFNVKAVMYPSSHSAAVDTDCGGSKRVTSLQEGKFLPKTNKFGSTIRTAQKHAIKATMELQIPILERRNSL
ncbi:MAG: hypothetical protein C7B43_16940 [Sulfobacillus benefaciens]|jgi:hypothetical protein|uniref:Uncharacterized protein n=1 Tax=Sulfobacillus benefaciens TaxID=453960 RepID=A0A2T2WSX6_9FIRM|nr:MAG: hypothetical protein C7B43_16940 [Sulfobacillus benefaciens]